MGLTLKQHIENVKKMMDTFFPNAVEMQASTPEILETCNNVVVSFYDFSTTRWGQAIVEEEEEEESQ